MKDVDTLYNIDEDWRYRPLLPESCFLTGAMILLFTGKCQLFYDSVTVVPAATVPATSSPSNPAAATPVPSKAPTAAPTPSTSISTTRRENRGTDCFGGALLWIQNAKSTLLFQALLQILSWRGQVRLRLRRPKPPLRQRVSLAYWALSNVTPHDDIVLMPRRVTV